MISNQELSSLFAYGTPFLKDEPCPECGENFTPERIIHRPCLEKKWDDVIPKEIEELIKQFNLEDKGEKQ